MMECTHTHSQSVKLCSQFKNVPVKFSSKERKSEYGNVLLALPKMCVVSVEF